MRAGDLEVHVAVEVLQTLNVHHGHPTLALGDQTAGDTCNRRLNRHAGVHERQSRAADRCLRGGTVGGNDLGYATDGIGEFLFAGQYGEQGALCKRAVTDLTSAGTADSLCFAGGVAGHIVVVHIALLGLIVDAVEHLLVAEGRQGCNRQNLGLTAGEHTAAVCTGQDADLCG